MKSDCERLYGEISEIVAQYQREVPSGRRAWPESIKSRVFALRKSGVRSAEISRRAGLPYYTVLQWKGRCGSCVTFATIGTLETQMNITRKTTDPPWSYSTQHLVYCGGGNCKDGWNANSAVGFLIRCGAPDEGCFPYTSGSNGEDRAGSLTCSDAAARSTRIAN